jgi:hypothetical protein
MKTSANQEYPAPEFTVEAATPLQQIIQALRGLHYGALKITVHDGRIVQIERREKRRPFPPVAIDALTSQKGAS